MPSAQINGSSLYYEVTGKGTPILFIHELAGDYRSWEPQVRAFSRSHTCVTYSARGYLPSGIPEEPASYSQQQSARDAIGLLNHLGIDRAHIVGLSMGAFVTVQVAVDFPDRAHTVTMASCGSGSEPHLYHSKQAAFRAMSEQVAEQGTTVFVQACDVDPTRESYKRKDPRGFAEFLAQLAEHDSRGLAHTLQGVQGSRPSLWDFQAQLQQTRIPALILCGDQDEPCLQPSLYLARNLSDARLAVIPGSGHVLNLEEPGLFNQILKDFIQAQ